MGICKNVMLLKVEAVIKEISSSTPKIRMIELEDFLGLRKQDLLDGLLEKNIKHHEWH